MQVKFLYGLDTCVVVSQEVQAAVAEHVPEAGLQDCPSVPPGPVVPTSRIERAPAGTCLGAPY